MSLKLSQRSPWMVFKLADYIKSIRSLVGHAPIRSVSVACIIENEQGQILLQKRSDTETWGTPGGNLELEEHIIEGLNREIREETGLELKNPTLFGIYSGQEQAFHYPNGDITYYVVVVFHEKLDSPVNLVLNEESLQLSFFSRDQIPDNIQITDQPWIKAWQSFDFKVKIA